MVLMEYREILRQGAKVRVIIRLFGRGKHNLERIIQIDRIAVYRYLNLRSPTVRHNRQQAQAQQQAPKVARVNQQQFVSVHQDKSTEGQKRGGQMDYKVYKAKSPIIQARSLQSLPVATLIGLPGSAKASRTRSNLIHPLIKLG